MIYFEPVYAISERYQGLKIGVFGMEWNWSDFDLLKSKRIGKSEQHVPMFGLMVFDDDLHSLI